MPDGPRLGDFKGHAREALHLSATKIWAVKALGDLPQSEWAPPKRRPRRFNVAFTLEGSANLDAETHGENVSEQLKPPRMRRAGVPFEVEATDVMSLEELKTAAMAALYGPLAKGADKERWRRVETRPDADAKSEDSWASEKEDADENPMDAESVVQYVGVADIRLERARPDYDPLVPASGAPREEVNDAAAWAAVAAAGPEPCEVARRETLRALARRAALWCSSGGEPEGRADESARTMTKEDVEAAAHGLWEMATDARARGAEDFHLAPEAFDAVVGLMEADDGIVTPAARRYALAAAWSLAVSARGRAGLLAAKGFKSADDDAGEGGAVIASAVSLLDAASAALERLEAEEAETAAETAKRAFAEEKRAESVGDAPDPEETPVATEPPAAEAASSAEAGETSAGGDASAADADASAAEPAPLESSEAAGPAPAGPAPAAPAPVSREPSDAVALFEHAVGAFGVLAVDTSFRAAYARADPSFSALVRACGVEPRAAPGGTPRVSETHAGLRAAAARALASTLIRDGDCRKRAIKSGGFGALVKLAADAANDDVRRAASETVASFAREPRIVSKVKTLDADVKTCARAMRRCLEAAPPGSDPALFKKKPSRVAKDTARAVCASMAGMLRALARRAASARKRAAADGDPARFAAATKPVTDGVLSQMVTHAHAVSTARRRQTFFFGETHAAASFGVLAALAEDRASCERLVRLGDRPRTPPPFTTEELETFQLEAFQARKEGRQYTQPVRVKAEWDPTLSIVETCKKTLSFSDQKSKSGSGEEGCARVAAAVVLARILEHERGRDEEEDVSSDHLSEDVENALEGEHRAFLAAEGAAAALLTSTERGASAAWRAPLAETSAAALMYLATPLEETCPRTPEELRRLAALAAQPVRDRDPADLRDDGGSNAEGDVDVAQTQTGVSAQFLAAAVWSIARSPLGRASLLRASPELIASLVAAGSALVPGAREAAEAENLAENAAENLHPDPDADADPDSDPRVVALEFLVATVWLLTYGDADPALEHGEVYDAADDGACYWTVARARAPTLAEAAADAAWAGAATARRGAPSPEDTRVAELRAEAAEARERVGRMRAIEQKGDSPPMTSKEAESAAVLAENAVLDAEAAARDAAAKHAENARGKRLAILTLLRDVVALPASRVTARARVAAVGAGWNACARSPEARREAMELGFFDVCEACALGGAAATTACVLVAYDAMEAMIGSYDDVCAFAGGPKRLARVAALLAKSDVPVERERGARALAFITSSRFADRADAAATKASLLADGAVASLLAMLCPEEDPEPEPMDEDDDTDDDEEEEDDEDDGSRDGDRDGSSSSSSTKRRSRSRNDIARSTEMFAAAALLNVSSLPAAQTALAKRGLYTLLKTNASAMTSRTSRFVFFGGGEVTGGDLIAGCIHNVAGHPANRTRMYKLELRAKAMERVLHNRRSAKHVGHKAAQAARLVGDAHERAAAAKTTFEKVTRRRRRVDAEHAPDPRAADPRDSHPATGTVANAEEHPGGGVAPPVAAESSSAAAADAPGEEHAADADAAPGPAARDSGSESDWSSSDGEDDAIARGDASGGRAAIRADDFPRAQADDDWLAGMMTRYAKSEAGESARLSGNRPNVSSAPEDAVFADGLALLAHSMRAPLRRVWSKPTRAPDARVTGDPEWTANRGATRVVMADPPRGAPRGDARWRPPVREYRERGATRSFVEEETFRSTSVSETRNREEKDAFFVEPTARRLLTASVSADATARLAGKAAEVAAEVAFGAPAAFGGLGSDAAGSGLAGSMRAPDPSLPVARASFARRRDREPDERTRDRAERRASSGGADASASAAKNDALSARDDGAADAAPSSTANDAALSPNPSRDQGGSVRQRASVPEPNEGYDETETRGTESRNDPSSPLEVVLEPCDRRRVVSFGAARDVARDSRVARLSVFEHTPGARAHLDAGIPAYRLPNGKRAFYYLAGGDVVGETSVSPPQPPARPTTLRRWRTLPASSGALRDAAALFFPEEFRPAPALCALPTKHTLDVADPRDVSRPSAFGDVRPRRARLFATEVLTRRAEEEHAAHAAHKKAMSFDVSKKGSAKVKRGVSFVEETDERDGSSETTAVFDAKEAFDPRRHSVFATRVDTADARDVYDGDAVYDAAFDADWRAWTRNEKGERFLTLRLARVAEAAVNAGEVMPPSPREKNAASELRAVARAYYDEIARAHKRFAAAFCGSSDAGTFPASAEACATRAVTLPRAGFDALAKKCAFAQTRTKCTEAHVAAFYETVAGSASAPLTRAQFLELLVRVADAKYAKSGAHHSLARALEALCENDLLPRAGAEFLADPDAWRANTLYVEETDDVFRGDVEQMDDAEEEEARLAAKFDEDTGARRDVSPPSSSRWRALRALFDALAAKNAARRVGFDAFASALAMAGVLETFPFSMKSDDDEKSLLPGTVKTRRRGKKKKLSVSDARGVFLAAQTFVARAEPPRDATLAFEDFLEALARVADAVPTPGDGPVKKKEPGPAEDDDAAETTSETTASEKKRSEKAESTVASSSLREKKTANVATDSGREINVDVDAPEDEGEGDLEEDAFAARSLASKLDEFLEHVLRRAWRAAGEDADAYDAERAAEAIEGLTL